MAILRGSCLCGAVGYRVADAFHAAFNCHCSQCRRATGAAYKPMAAIAFEKLEAPANTDDLLIYGTPPGSHDVHCLHCGSFLYSFIAGNGNAHIAMGTLIDTPSIRPMFHMFVGSKAPWHEIADDLPQFDTFPT